LVSSVVEDFFFRKYFLVERELQEAGLLDLDLEFSCRNFSYLNVCIMVRLFEFCFTLLQVDFLDVGFLFSGAPTARLSSMDFTRFLSSLLWKVGMRIYSVRLKEGTVAKGSLLLTFPFYLLQLFFFLNIQTVIISNLPEPTPQEAARTGAIWLFGSQSFLPRGSTLYNYIISMTE
jgi:hypothetical protein